ncbi:hypothetical protein HanIR_Chr17g0850031 [Helianthus annuus]|nr:hypothetical protein HanIR_Chr17g0850031 [Helianthus annuus]
MTLFVFVHLINQTKFLVHVRSFIKQTKVNALPRQMVDEQFVKCSDCLQRIDCESFYKLVSRKMMQTGLIILIIIM